MAGAVQGHHGVTKQLHRQMILQLYRQCLQSAHRIPDGSHRATYLDYTRQGFRDRARLPQDAKETIRAIRDAEEQLERMNYYHSIREEKIKQQQYQHQLQQQQDQKHKSTTDVPNQHPEQTINNTNGNQPIHKPLNLNFDHYRNNRTDLTESNTSHMRNPDPGQSMSIPREWLLKALPELQPQDLDTYSQILLQEGFDSKELLEKYLVIQDLDFMKKAHGRALIHFYGLAPAPDTTSP